MKVKIYFNFPIILLKDFLSDTPKVMNEIMYYALFNHTNTLRLGSEEDKIESAYRFFGLIPGDKKLILGKKLVNSIGFKTPKVGINKDICFDFYENHKTEFEKVCLLAFLAIKSVLGDKAYIKLTNRFWLSRMAGNAKTCGSDELPKWLKKYDNEYQTKKIKIELRNNWGLKTYSRYTRGFYVSFILDIDTLIFEAEKRRKSIKEKNYKKLENEALKKALLKLNNIGEANRTLIETKPVPNWLNFQNR